MISEDSLALYADPENGLPQDGAHIHVFCHSHAALQADPKLGAAIHAGGPSFRYAPAFDLSERPGWQSASRDQLADWARAYRQEALAAGADMFSFNELVSVIPGSEPLRRQVIALLRLLAGPDEVGGRLAGVLFLVEQAATPGNWTSPASVFWQAVDETCDLVVAEHYHGHGFVCDQTPQALATHLFSMREWLNRSGEPAKVQIANQKFTVLHSARYGPGDSVWSGADSTSVSLPAFQRNLSKCARATRVTPGGNNRIAFGPATTAYTDPRVHPRIGLLIRWHYDQNGSPRELACVDLYEDNCRC
jgi:hypothetical protein